MLNDSQAEMPQLSAGLPPGGDSGCSHQANERHQFLFLKECFKVLFIRPKHWFIKQELVNLQ